MNQVLSFAKPDKAKTAAAAPAWKVAPQQPARKPALIQRILGKAEPTTYQRCLAVHLHFAAPRGGLS